MLFFKQLQSILDCVSQPLGVQARLEELGLKENDFFFTQRKTKGAEEAAQLRLQNLEWTLETRIKRREDWGGVQTSCSTEGETGEANI